MGISMTGVVLTNRNFYYKTMKVTERLNTNIPLNLINLIEIGSGVGSGVLRNEQGTDIAINGEFAGSMGYMTHLGDDQDFIKEVFDAFNQSGILKTV